MFSWCFFFDLSDNSVQLGPWLQNAAHNMKPAQSKAQRKHTTYRIWSLGDLWTRTRTVGQDNRECFGKNVPSSTKYQLIRETSWKESCWPNRMMSWKNSCGENSKVALKLVLLAEQHFVNWPDSFVQIGFEYKWWSYNEAGKTIENA